MNRPDPSLLHIILYAKYHYKTELSVVDALSVLVGERCMLHPSYIHPGNLYNVLFQCLRQCEGLNWENIFERYIDHFHANPFVPTAGWNDDSHTARFNHLLGIIAHTKASLILIPMDSDSRSPEIWRKLEEFRTMKVMKEWQGLGWRNNSKDDLTAPVTYL